MEAKEVQRESDSDFEKATRKLEKEFPGAKTIGECLHCHYERSLSKRWQKLPEGDAFKRQFLRYYEPWPEWTILCAAEVCSVFVPRVRRKVIHDSFKLLHGFIFEARFDGTEFEHPPVFPQIDAQILGTLVGHGLAMTGLIRAKFDDVAESGRLSQEEIAEFEAKFGKQLSAEEFQREIQPHLSKYFGARPAKWAEFCEAMADAKRKTFDAQGSLRETTSTSVYSKILEDWPVIEEMSGPTELCRFLDPVLVGSDNDPDKKLDRVKKICRRLKIRFRPVVKG